MEKFRMVLLSILFAVFYMIFVFYEKIVSLE
ncbi:hypothetical protein J2S74_005463 [Evansella vedderi]|uniref:VanZ family protein n=1 Tax=Evansella vedderi TaxID=38282 RepID=A0ABU0A3C7_9BACI|nr:hypothetical protein [Evansella vedderi]